MQLLKLFHKLEIISKHKVTPKKHSLKEMILPENTMQFEEWLYGWQGVVGIRQATWHFAGDQGYVSVLSRF